ncbi:MAG TPA: GntR family transcriptional regulator [Devosiaceae bacterium]|jgi:DNA-binding GntR family transcriptional regulator|nr:GntR family transcriptional regulator [Devosiaceae bacterium]
MEQGAKTDYSERDRFAPDETFQIGTNYSRLGDAMRQAIFSGEFEPGMRLKVQDLSRRYMVSTNPIREALQQLQGEGLVDIVPNRGATVRVITRQLVSNIFDIREAIDVMLARRAVKVVTPENIEHLRQINLRLHEARLIGDGEQASALSSGFHEYIGEIVGNPQAVKVRRDHSNIFRSIRMRYGFAEGREAEIIREHEEIIDALASGEEDRAEAAVLIHAQNAKADILDRVTDLAEF